MKGRNDDVVIVSPDGAVSHRQLYTDTTDKKEYRNMHITLKE